MVGNTWWPFEPSLKQKKGTVFQRIAKLKPYIHYMNINERKEIIYSKALSIAKYGLEFYFGQPQLFKDRLLLSILPN